MVIEEGKAHGYDSDVTVPFPEENRNLMDCMVEVVKDAEKSGGSVDRRDLVKRIYGGYGKDAEEALESALAQKRIIQRGFWLSVNSRFDASFPIMPFPNRELFQIEDMIEFVADSREKGMDRRAVVDIYTECCSEHVDVHAWIESALAIGRLVQIGAKLCTRRASMEDIIEFVYFEEGVDRRTVVDAYSEHGDVNEWIRNAMELGRLVQNGECLYVKDSTHVANHPTW